MYEILLRLGPLVSFTALVLIVLRSVVKKDRHRRQGLFLVLCEVESYSLDGQYKFYEMKYRIRRDDKMVCPFSGFEILDTEVVEGACLICYDDLRMKFNFCEPSSEDSLAWLSKHTPNKFKILARRV